MTSFASVSREKNHTVSTTVMIMDKYDEEYFNKTHKMVRFLIPEKRPLWIRWVKTVRKYRPSGRLLDIGCGEGYFLHYAEMFYETYGMDISEYCVTETLSRTNKSTVSTGDITKIKYDDKYFDVVTCFDIMEHVSNYGDAIKECNRVLKDKGILILRVPNTSSLGNKWKKEEWFAYKDETHVTLLPKEKWLEAIKKQGFEIKGTIYDGLWDVPYFKKVPVFIQTVLIKLPSIFLVFIGFKFTEKYGENVCIVAQK
jgi:2-polyprenyl-3-methyl-5-hydroxy-6-metoxy-1,4-benzoquinol methylase